MVQFNYKPFLTKKVIFIENKVILIEDDRNFECSQIKKKTIPRKTDVPKTNYSPRSETRPNASFKPRTSNFQGTTISRYVPRRKQKNTHALENLKYTTSES